MKLSIGQILYCEKRERGSEEGQKKREETGGERSGGKRMKGEERKKPNKQT